MSPIQATSDTSWTQTQASLALRQCLQMWLTPPLNATTQTEPTGSFEYSLLHVGT